MIDIFRGWSRDLWRWLLRLAHIHPLRGALMVIVALMLASGVLGEALVRWQGTLVTWLDNGFIVLGGLSLSAGWALALVLYARRRDAALSFRHAGAEVDCPRFKAGLILASTSRELMDWHLRHIPHERVEFVWTAFTRDAAAQVIEGAAGLYCLHGPRQGPDAPECGDDPDCLDEPFDLVAVKAHCDTLLRELLARYAAEEICVNITGSTAVMTLGAFQAAEELGITSLYLLGNHRNDRGQPIIRRSRIADRSEGQIKLISDHSGSTGADAPESEAAT